MTCNNILVINGGSSSFKYQVLDMNDERRLCQGLVDKIGKDDSLLRHKRFPDTPREEEFTYPGQYANHTEGMQAVAKILFDTKLGGMLTSIRDLRAIGHRVVLAGSEFAEALVTEQIKELIQSYIPLSPLHNPANLAGIAVTEKLFPGLPNVAVFDTGFHTTMPPEAHTYAIPQALSEKHRIRRYGFHGTSHRYVAQEAAKLANKPFNQFNTITCHLGNGCSITAVKNGQSMDTSMGLTPLEGLVMGTRSGDIDPAIITYLMKTEGFTPQSMDELLNKQSGLKGLTGNNDMRDIEDACAAGDPNAMLAFNVFVYAIRKYIGSYYPVLGRVDCIVFTGGIGENSSRVRQAVCANMDALGIAIQADLNQARSSRPRSISPAETKTPVYVIPTNEELEIARATVRVISSK